MTIGYSADFQFYTVSIQANLNSHPFPKMNYKKLQLLQCLSSMVQIKAHSWHFNLKVTVSFQVQCIVIKDPAHQIKRVSLQILENYTEPP